MAASAEVGPLHRTTSWTLLHPTILPAHHADHGAGTLQTTLQDARDLLEKVCNTGPLEALLKATFVRDDFNRINRDLINTFQLLASIEKLLVGCRGSTCSYCCSGLKADTLLQFVMPAFIMPPALWMRCCAG
jgi:hypothetical protein